MNQQKLSSMYFHATNSISDTATVIYEYLHSENGTPKNDYPTIERDLKRYLAEIRNHFDLIRESCKEFNETNN
jgi:hypothetical protein